MAPVFTNLNDTPFTKTLPQYASKPTTTIRHSRRQGPPPLTTPDTDEAIPTQPPPFTPSVALHANTLGPNSPDASVPTSASPPVHDTTSSVDNANMALLIGVVVAGTVLVALLAGGIGVIWKKRLARKATNKKKLQISAPHLLWSTHDEKIGSGVTPSDELGNFVMISMSEGDMMARPSDLGASSQEKTTTLNDFGARQLSSHMFLGATSSLGSSQNLQIGNSQRSMSSLPSRGSSDYSHRSSAQPAQSLSPVTEEAIIATPASALHSFSASVSSACEAFGVHSLFQVDKDGKVVLTPVTTHQGPAKEQAREQEAQTTPDLADDTDSLASDESFTNDKSQVQCAVVARLAHARSMEITNQGPIRSTASSPCMTTPAISKTVIQPPLSRSMSILDSFPCAPPMLSPIAPSPTSLSADIEESISSWVGR